MSYYLSKVTNKSFNQVLAEVSKALKEEGSGIITEIDADRTEIGHEVQQKLKSVIEKL